MDPSFRSVHFVSMNIFVPYAFKICGVWSCQGALSLGFSMQVSVIQDYRLAGEKVALFVRRGQGQSYTRKGSGARCPHKLHPVQTSSSIIVLCIPILSMFSMPVCLSERV